jgi:hypothetical protein
MIFAEARETHTCAPESVGRLRRRGGAMAQPLLLESPDPVACRRTDWREWEGSGWLRGYF